MNPLRLLARWLFRKFGLERRGTSVYGYVEGGFSIFINLILFLIKFVMGQRTESIALKADSFHTLGDVATSLIIVIGFFIALRPADQRHPFGHGRTERIIAIVIATLLCVVAYEFFAGSLIRFLKPQPVRFSWLAIFILTVSIILKEMLTIFSLMLFQTSGYQSLKADAWHHRSDSLATALV
ncbi:MAG TPA: cation diffusion facilitator family transporter, partial [bacterium]|nr:cation diffusion facilitator family transporter [bacterium]